MGKMDPQRFYAGKYSHGKNMNVIASSINPKHCANCLNMNGCCFVKDKSPENPLHERCHCYYENIGIPDVKIISAIEKYTKYIFDNKKTKGKKLYLNYGVIPLSIRML